MKRRNIVTIVVAMLLAVSFTSSFYFFILQKDQQEKKIEQLQSPLIYLENTSGKAPLTIYPRIKNEVEESIQIKWDFGDNSRSDHLNPEHTYTKPGEYLLTLSLSDNIGNSGTDSILINVFENKPPKITAISADKISGRAPMKITLNVDATDPDGTIVSYSWDFDDLELFKNSDNLERNPEHTYLFSGTYCVKCTVTDNDGSSDTSMIKIEVKPNIIITGIRTFRTIRWIYNSLTSFFLIN